MSRTTDTPHAIQRFLDNLVNNRIDELKKDYENRLQDLVGVDALAYLYTQKYQKGNGLFRLILWEFKNDKKFSLEPQKTDKNDNITEHRSTSGTAPETGPQIFHGGMIEQSKAITHTSNAEYLKTVGKIIKSLSKKKLSNLYKIRNPGTFVPSREIFLWAVMTGMEKKTKLLLWKCLERDHVVNAVIASTLMKSMAELLSKRSFTLPKEDPYLNTTMAQDESEYENKNKIFHVAAKLLSEAKEYGSLADGVLQVCYNKHSNHLSYLLVRELPDWSNKSLFLMKYKGQLQLAETDKQFLNLAKDRMKETWYKNIDTDTSLWKILPCIFLPFMFLHFIKFNYSYKLNDSRKESTYEIYWRRNSRKRIPKAFGINYSSFILHQLWNSPCTPCPTWYTLFCSASSSSPTSQLIKSQFMKYWSGRGHWQCS